jgi:hypothetical protein
MNEKRSNQLMGAQPKTPGGLTTGQAIVIVAVAAVGLIAIMGLAIDGGRLLLLRRDEQNAGDAATLASTLALCSGGTEPQVIAAGESAASANGYVNGINDTTVTIDPNPPASSVPAGTCLECSVLVKIEREIQPYFIQLVYSGSLQATTSSVGSCNPDNITVDLVDTDGDGVGDLPAPDIGALWAGGTGCEANATVSSGAFYGLIHSNGDLKFQPSNTSGSCDTVPNPITSGGWTFGEITYSNEGGGSGFSDAKSVNCEYADWSGAVIDPPVCGATCTTSSDGPDGDLDPVRVDPYIDVNGDPIWPDEADYDIADFRPGGAIATSLGANYHVVTSCGNFFDSYVGPGVYYTTCDFNLKKGDAPAGNIEATLVAEGQVKFHLETSWDGWYPQSADPTHRLAVMANGGGGTASCNAHDLHVTSTNGSFTGIMFAPYGEAKFSTSSTTTQAGCVVGYQANISSSGASIHCEPGDSGDRGSINLTD